MTAAKIMDIISRLQGCDGQAAEAVSVLYPSKNGRCSQIIENSKIGVSRHLDSSTTIHMTKIMVQYSVVPLVRILYGPPFGGLSWQRQFEKILLKHGWEKVPNLECLFLNRGKRIILICVCG